MDAHCKDAVSQELIWVLSWNFQRRLKGEGHLTRRQCVHTTTNTTATATFTTTTTSIAPTSRDKGVEMKILRSSLCEYTGYRKDISATP